MIISQSLAFAGIGGWELLAVLFVILLLFGAKKLPELARSLGSAKKEFTKAAREVDEEIEKMKESPPANGDSSKKPESKS